MSTWGCTLVGAFLGQSLWAISTLQMYAPFFKPNMISLMTHRSSIYYKKQAALSYLSMCFHEHIQAMNVIDYP